MKPILHLLSVIIYLFITIQLKKPGNSRLAPSVPPTSFLFLLLEYYTIMFILNAAYRKMHKGNKDGI